MAKLELPIKGYEGMYTIDEDGTVRSYVRPGGPYIIAPFVKNDYLMVNLVKNGKRKTHRLHRLVAMAHVPNPHPRKYKIVLHKNDDKLDPRAVNLKWGTNLHNTRDMMKKGRHRNQHTAEVLGRVDE